MKRFLELLFLFTLLVSQEGVAHPMDEWFVNLQVQEGRHLTGSSVSRPILKGCSVLAALTGIYWTLERMGF